MTKSSYDKNTLNIKIINIYTAFPIHALAKDKYTKVNPIYIRAERDISYEEIKFTENSNNLPITISTPWSRDIDWSESEYDNFYDPLGTKKHAIQKKKAQEAREEYQNIDGIIIAININKLEDVPKVKGEIFDKVSKARSGLGEKYQNIPIVLCNCGNNSKICEWINDYFLDTFPKGTLLAETPLKAAQLILEKLKINKANSQTKIHSKSHVTQERLSLDDSQKKAINEFIELLGSTLNQIPNFEKQSAAPSKTGNVVEFTFDSQSGLNAFLAENKDFLTYLKDTCKITVTDTTSFLQRLKNSYTLKFTTTPYNELGEIALLCLHTLGTEAFNILPEEVLNFDKVTQNESVSYNPLRKESGKTELKLYFSEVDRKAFLQQNEEDLKQMCQIGIMIDPETTPLEHKVFDHMRVKFTVDPSNPEGVRALDALRKQAVFQIKTSIASKSQSVRT